MTSPLRSCWFFAALIVLLTPCAGATTAAPPASTNYVQNPQLWPQDCAKIRAKLSESPAAFLTFTPLPKTTTNPAKVWRLNWRGLSIPVPAMPYTKIVWLGYPKVFSMLFLSSPNDHRVFSVMSGHVHHNQLEKESSGAEKTTQEADNEKNNLVAPLVQAFSITPKNLTCSTKNIRQQRLDAVVLRLKTRLHGLDHPVAVGKAGIVIPAQKLIAAHKIARPEAGVLTYARTSSNEDIYSYALQDGPHAWFVKYRFNENESSLRHTALLLTTPEAAAYSSPPVWFQRLQTWLDKPAHPQWCKLLSALKRAHFDASSLRRLARWYSNCQRP